MWEPRAKYKILRLATLCGLRGRDYRLYLLHISTLGPRFVHSASYPPPDTKCCPNHPETACLARFDRVFGRNTRPSRCILNMPRSALRVASLVPLEFAGCRNSERKPPTGLLNARFRLNPNPPPRSRRGAPPATVQKPFQNNHTGLWRPWGGPARTPRGGVGYPNTLEPTPDPPWHGEQWMLLKKVAPPCSVQWARA